MKPPSLIVGRCTLKAHAEAEVQRYSSIIELREKLVGMPLPETSRTMVIGLDEEVRLWATLPRGIASNQHHAARVVSLQPSHFFATRRAGGHFAFRMGGRFAWRPEWAVLHVDLELLELLDSVAQSRAIEVIASVWHPRLNRWMPVTSVAHQRLRRAQRRTDAFRFLNSGLAVLLGALLVDQLTFLDKTNEDLTPRTIAPRPPALPQPLSHRLREADRILGEKLPSDAELLSLSIDNTGKIDARISAASHASSATALSALRQLGEVQLSGDLVEADAERGAAVLRVTVMGRRRAQGDSR